VGPGRVIDTNRYHVICPNLLGGCYGTTGPSFPHPEDQEPYGERFPLLTPRDLMRAQRLFLDTLGLSSLALVIGPSMGGMVAWEWLLEEPGRVEAGVVVAAPLASGPYQIGLSWLQRSGIALDLGEAGGKGGRTLARGVGMMSYRSPRGLWEKFGREWFKPPGSTLAEPGIYNVESWLAHHGKRLIRRFDPLTYSLFSRTMDLHDVARSRGSRDAALRRLVKRSLLVSISSDQLYPADELRRDADDLRAAGVPFVHETIESPHGHDGFLLDTGPLGEILGRFLHA
jgi:homoserine O-acetyltransferase